MEFFVDPDITKAETLPAEFYLSEQLFEASKEALFAKVWHWAGDQSDIASKGSVKPFHLYPHFLGEPLLLANQGEGLKCLSNVCTHRANLVVDYAGKYTELRCGYHGRRFELDGKFKSMPEFKEAENFPRPCDHLREFPIKKLGPFIWLGLEPSYELDSVLNFINERVSFLSLDQFSYREDLSKDYLVNAHWALYCDNYLEGFHIPFVHDDLNKVLNYGKYRTVLSDYANLQIGYSDGAEEIFDLPADHPDAGEEIAAYYFWIFPNVMLNFYPWGLSVNTVNPLSRNKTKVSFITYIWDETKFDLGAGAMLDKVEREDEFVVESVQRGLSSKFYPGGRFSPTREQGVHQFHRLLAQFMSD